MTSTYPPALRLAGAVKRGSPRSIAILLALASSSAAAAPPVPDHFTYEWWSGLQYSDNREQTETAARSDLVFVPQLNLSLLHTGTRWRSHGVGEFHAERSLRGGTNQDLLARVALAADFALLPQRLYWTFQDYADVQSIDPLAADGPRNQQQTNVFITGPVLLLGSPRTLTSRVEARFAHSYAEETSAFNQDRYSLSAWLQRQSDPVRRWSLGLESSDVSFREAGTLADFQRHDVLLRYDHELPRAGLEVVAGRTWIDLDQGDTFSHELLRATLRWSAGDGHEFRGAYSDELSDASRDLSMAVDAGDPLRPQTHRALMGADLYRLRSAELQWLRRGPRSQWALTPFARDYDYLGETGGLERRSRGVRATGTLAISPLLSLHAEAAAERFDFATATRRDRDSRVTLFAHRRLTPGWSVRAGIGRYLRRSDAPDASYRENTASVFLVYTGGR